MKKTSSLAVPALEAAGLGILARPSIKTLRNKGSSHEERSNAKHEVAGLGVLAAHPMYELGKAAIGKFKKAGVGLSLVKLSGAFDKVNARPMTPPTTPAAKPQFTMEHLNKQRESMGMKAVSPRPMTPKAGTVAKAAKPAVSAATHAVEKPGLLSKALSIFRKA